MGARKRVASAMMTVTTTNLVDLERALFESHCLFAAARAWMPHVCVQQLLELKTADKCFSVVRQTTVCAPASVSDAFTFVAASNRIRCHACVSASGVSGPPRAT